MDDQESALTAAFQAAQRIIGLADTLFRIARGEQPHGEWGNTKKELAERAEAVDPLLAGARQTEFPKISAAPALWPNQIPAVEIAGAFGCNYHRAVVRLAMDIDRDRFFARADSGGHESPFKKYWPKMAKLLAAKPAFNVSMVAESLRAEWLEARSKIAPGDIASAGGRKFTQKELDHSDDFASLRWNGALYHFGPPQAAAVKLLYEAADGGYYGVGSAALLNAAWGEDTASDDDTRKVSDLFKGSDAWEDGTITKAKSKNGTEFRTVFRLSEKIS